jgi:hypothetical protein
MISEFAMTRDLPEKARKPYRQFLFGYCFSVAFLAALCAVIHYKSIIDPSTVGGAAVPAAFIGVVMTALLGGAAVRCIHAVARATGSSPIVRSRK